MNVIAVTNLKGGTGKTTTAAYIGHELASLGKSVLLVDADPQGSLLRWSESSEWELPTISLPVKNLHARLPGISSKNDWVVIDTPPLDEQSGIVYSALRLADRVIIPMAPTMMEFERLGDIFAAIEEVEPLRLTHIAAYVLLSRTVSQASSTQTFRELITESGHTVLNSAIPRRELIAQAFGDKISTPSPYSDSVAEIVNLKEDQ